MRGMRIRTAAAFVAAAASCLGFVGTGTAPAVAPPLPPHQVFEAIDRDAAQPRFDGTLHGWRVAPYASLEADGLGDSDGPAASLPGCVVQPSIVDPGTLGVAAYLLPAGVAITSDTGPGGWACGSASVATVRSFQIESPYGSGYLHIARTSVGARVLEVDAAADRVEAGLVGGLPAVLVHMADDATGLGQAEIVVIERDALDPFSTVLRVTADGVPFEALRAVAEALS